MLDQFSANATSQPKVSAAQTPSQPAPITSGPGRPSDSTSASAPATQSEPSLPHAQRADESEHEFIERLSKEMSTMIESFSADPSMSPQSPEDLAKMGKQLEDFTYQMEKEGIQPEDLLKALLGEEEGTKIADLAHAERDKQEKSPPPSSSSRAQAQSPASPSASSKTPKSFEDTIRSTMSRLGESDKHATTASQKSTQKSEEDLLAEMLRALDAGPGSSSGENDDGLSKMFMDMMQQLTHKDLLYDPMRELHSQYPAWLEANKSKLDPKEYARYERQSVIVADITRKFEEPGFSDDNPECKEYIWEKMQKMQDEGAPPEELVKNPFPGTELGGLPGFGGGGGDQLPEGLGKELEEGCPTQ